VPQDGFSQSIQDYASAALSLQESRHIADYDPRPRFRAADANLAIAAAQSALAEWNTAPIDQRDALLWLLLFRPR
jgi:hypothetical protein